MNFNKNILLVDSTLDLELIKKQSLASKIISLDYDTHRTLLHNKIEHDVSDTFLLNTELEEIQDYAYQFSNWSTNPKIKDDLLYSNVNIGRLFYVELYVFLLEFLKKFIEIYRIYTQFSDHKFLISDINSKIIQMFTNDVEIIKTKNNTQQFYYDSITFESKYLKIKMSRTNYLKVKNYLDKLSKSFLNSKVTHNNIMLVEFNTVFYKKLFYKLKDHILFFGLRRPSIWNMESYSVISKSNSQLISTYDLLDDELKNKIINETKLMREKINKLLANSDFFTSFFTINGVSIWNALKPSLSSLIDRHIEESISYIEIIQKSITKFKPSKLLILSESGPAEQIIISKAKELVIPIVLLQHGNFHDNPNGHKYNQFTGSVLSDSDQFLVWGNSMLKYAREYNLPISRMHALGSCLHDRAFEIAKKQTVNKNFILISAQGPLNMHVMDHTIKANEEYEKIIEKICKISTKLNKKLVIKLHPYEDDNYESEIAQKIEPTIKVLKNGDALELIRSCDFMISVGTSISSIVYDAHILKKPVLRIPFGDWFGQPDQSRPSSCYNVDIDELEFTIVKLSTDQAFRKKILDDGYVFINNCLSNHNDAAKHIANFLLEQAK